MRLSLDDNSGDSHHENTLRLTILITAICRLSPAAFAQLIPSADGATVYDVHLKGRWLADANFAHSPAGQTIASNAKVAVTPGGSMTFDNATKWVHALNTLNAGQPNSLPGYLGHTTWQLPLTPSHGQPDAGCTSHGTLKSGFGYGCTGSDMGSLYSTLGFLWPDTAVPIPYDAGFPFHNFQPYLYWSGDKFRTFSFNNGWAGTNTNIEYLNLLPMLPHKVNEIYNKVPVTWINLPSGLQVSADGLLVYDPPPIDVTFLADANLARSQKFSADCLSYTPSDHQTHFPTTRQIPCIDPDGAMSHEIAQKWLAEMNAFPGPNYTGWLGHTKWQLPPDPGGCESTGCVNTPMGDLYYNKLHLTRGTPVVPTPPGKVGPFKNLQPYLYWSCSADVPGAVPCPQANADPNHPQEWSFSFGNGFQGTDILGNDLYVMVYFPQTTAQALTGAIQNYLGVNRTLFDQFQTLATSLIMAPSPQAKSADLTAFINHVNAQRGKALASAQADELLALAQAI